MARIDAGRRADEDEARVGARLREVGLLGEEAVAGMDGLRAGLLRRGEHLGGVEIALARRRGPEAHRLVARLHVQRVRVGVGKHRDRLDTERPRGPRDAAGNLSTIGDEDLSNKPSSPPQRRRSLP